MALSTPRFIKLAGGLAVAAALPVSLHDGLSSAVDHLSAIGGTASFALGAPAGAPTGRAGAGVTTAAQPPAEVRQPTLRATVQAPPTGASIVARTGPLPAVRPAHAHPAPPAAPAPTTARHALRTPTKAGADAGTTTDARSTDPAGDAMPAHAADPEHDTAPEDGAGPTARASTAPHLRLAPSHGTGVGRHRAPETPGTSGGGTAATGSRSTGSTPRGADAPAHGCRTSGGRDGAGRDGARRDRAATDGTGNDATTYLSAPGGGAA
jgi:flagellar hook-length control protein FliK